MIYYYSIHKKIKNDIVINKSRFLTYLFPIDDINEAEKHIHNIRKEHPKANHHCFAYHIEGIDEVGIHKASDDGEPSGTAGIPMLETIKKTSISHILAIVVRYFGGVKLGSGGLIRAYSSSVSEAIQKADIIAHSDQVKFSIIVDYNQNDPFHNYIQKISNVNVLNIEYTECVTYTLSCSPEKYESVSQMLINFLNGKTDITHHGIFMTDIPIQLSDISND